MSEYIPKVADRVRATLGENVLVGIVTDAVSTSDDSWIDIKIHHDAFDFPLWASDGWRLRPAMTEQEYDVAAAIRYALVEVHV